MSRIFLKIRHLDGIDPQLFGSILSAPGRGSAAFGTFSADLIEIFVRMTATQNNHKKQL
jgi:hypothetical protein